MDEAGSVTRLIPGFKKGDEEAVREVWARYFDCLVQRAERRGQGRVSGEADGEDLALSAFHTAHRAVREGRFDQLSNRNDLLQIFFCVLSRKVADYVKRARQQRRDCNRVTELLTDVEDGNLGPALETLMADECRALLKRLDEEILRQIALDRVAGWTNEEIAERLGCSQRSVERKVARIRSIWQGEE